MTHRLGAECSDIIAAIAPVAGSIGGRASINSPIWYPEQPLNPVSVLIIHGTVDSHVLYEGGHGPNTSGTRVDISVPRSVNFWVNANGCDSDSPMVSDSDSIQTTTYLRGRDDTVVELITIEGGGHVWPGSNRDPFNRLDASRVIWEFFKTHQSFISLTETHFIGKGGGSSFRLFTKVFSMQGYIGSNPLPPTVW